MPSVSHRAPVTCVLATLVAGLAVGPAAAQDHKLKFDEALIPRFNIPYMSKPPKIDGRIDPDEWRDSVKIMGVVRTGGKDFRDRPIAFRVAWDEKHVYLATRSDILPGHRLYKSKRERITAGVVFDDSFEFGLFLHGRNKLPGEHASYLKFIINFLGSGEYMKLYPSIGQNLFNWRPDMKIANRIHQAGGRRWWHMEIAADLPDLQMPAEHKAGDAVWLLLAADLKNPQWQWLDVPTASGHLQHYGFPRAVLTKDKPYVQVERLSGLHDGRLDLDSVIHNPSARPAKVTACARILHGEVGAQGAADRKSDPDNPRHVVDVSRTLTVPAKRSARFDVHRALPPLDYPKPDRARKVRAKFSTYDYRVALADDAKAPAVYAYNMSFIPSDKSYLKAVPRTTVFEVAMDFNPVKGLLFLSGDTLDARVPQGARIAAMAYEITTGGKAFRKGRITRAVHYKYEDLIKLGDLRPGEYHVALRMLDAAGKVLAERAGLKFEKKDEPKVFAKWWNNRIGDTKKVLKPFEPLKVMPAEAAAGFASSPRVSCTRRTYAFDSLCLPVQIRANGGSVLSAPARIVVKVGGREHVVPADKRLRFVSSRPYRVEFAGGQSTAGGVRFGAAGWMEQDGLVDVTLTYAPAGGPVDVEELRIEWPVDDTLGLHMACIGQGGNYCARTIGSIPGGEGKVWDTAAGIGLAGCAMTVGSFTGNLWVGTEKRGLLWCADSDRGWVPDNAAAAHSLARKGGTVIVRNHLIGTRPGGKPFRLTGPRTVRFGYNASPFRKLSPGWRVKQVSAANGFSHGKYKVDWDTGQHWFSVLSPPFRDVKRWPEYYAHCKAEALKRSRRGLYGIGPRLTFYLANQIALRGYQDKSLEPGVYGYFAGDWVPGGETLSKTYRDYMIWLQDKQVREGGCTHFYYDISFTGKLYRKLSAGFGYRLADGRTQPEGCDDNLRRWTMRTWAMIQENGLYPGGVSGHATNSISLKALPFADAILDSEYPMKDPISVYPSDRMIALSCPHSFGVNISHLGFMNPNWSAMHDAGQGGGQGGVFGRAAFRHWGIARDDVEFVPYWRNGHVVKGIPGGVLVSLWRRPGSAALAVLNYGPDAEGQERTRPVRMTLDLKALGVPAGSRGERLRVRQLYSNPARGRYLGHLPWYKDLPADADESKRHPDARKRTVPPIHPKLDPRTGVLDAFDVRYHDVRYLVIHWEDSPVDDSAWAGLFAGELRREALDWGIGAPGTEPLAGRALAEGVKLDAPAVRAHAWKRPNTVLLRFENTADKPVRAVAKLDLRRLGVKVEPGELWKKYTQVYDLQHVRFGLWSPGARADFWEKPDDLLRAVGRAGMIAFDGWHDLLGMHLGPKQVRCVSIDTY